MKIGKVAGSALVGACLLAGGAVADEMSDGSFAMPQEVVCAATAFQDYMSSAGRIDGGFASGDASTPRELGIDLSALAFGRKPNRAPPWVSVCPRFCPYGSEVPVAVSQSW